MFRLKKLTKIFYFYSIESVFVLHVFFHSPFLRTYKTYENAIFFKTWKCCDKQIKTDIEIDVLENRLKHNCVIDYYFFK